MKMIDIDSLLLEWSVRCPKGYPDLNDPKDMTILYEILSEQGISLPTSETIVSENKITQEKLADILKSGEYSEKTLDKIRSLVTRSTGIEDFVEKFLHDIVPNKERRFVDDIMDIMLDSGVNQEKLKTYLSNRTIEYKDFIGTATSIASKFEATGLSSKAIESLSSFVKKGVGPFEWLLAIVLSGAKRPAGAGDLEIGESPFEIKAFKGRILPVNGLADASTARNSFITSYKSLIGELPESSQNQWNEIMKAASDSSNWGAGQILNTLDKLHENFINLAPNSNNKLNVITDTLTASLKGYYINEANLNWIPNVLNQDGSLNRREFVKEWAVTSFDYYIRQTDSNVKYFIVTNSGTGENKKSLSLVKILIFPVENFRKHLGTDIGLDLPSFSETAGQGNAFGLKLGSKTAVLK